MTESADLDDKIVACLESLGADAETLLRPHASLHPEAPDTAPPVSVSDGARTKALVDGVSSAIEIEGPLGQGGMGVVQLATQRSLGRKVAVKRLRPENTTHGATLELLREARITGALEHPNIPPVHDLRLDELGRPQILLKRIEGISWDVALHDAAIVRERFGADDLLEHNLNVLMQICRAVHFAHSRRVVHRDLKPSNVMIGTHGEVYLLDWGIAVSLDDDPAIGALAKKRKEAAGTPGYMAPELLLGEPVSERTDVYLLGAILYEIFDRKPPHRGATPREVARSVLLSAPAAPPGAPFELVAVIRRAMARRPDDRYASAEELRVAVASFLQHRTAIRLAEEADRRLRSLSALAEGGGARSLASRAEAYELYGGACFGYREALAIWPDYAAAREGVRRAIITMIELELACDETNGASQLLASLDEPPSDLRARVEQAVATSLEERQRILSLEALGEDRDAARGARTRRILVGALGVIWSLAPLFTAWAVDPIKDQYPPMWLAPSAALVVLAVLTYWGRRDLRQTAINRGVVATIAVGVIGQLAVALGGPLIGQSDVHARIHMLLVWAIVVAMAAVTIDRRLAPGAAVALAAYALAAIYAKTVAPVQYAMAATYFAISINALAIWRAEPPDPRGTSSRSGGARSLRPPT
ncbi:MAG: serine/threonine protein kinase [Labilithrix sp.]|nr:serine/threonine protein kinase [Labilithrix sp.]